MAGAIVANYTNGATFFDSSGTVTVSVGASSTSGNLLVAILSLRSANVLTAVGTPSTWTKAEDGVSGDFATGYFYKVASGTSNDDFLITFTTTSGGARQACYVLEISGLDSTPFEDSAEDATQLGTAASTVGTGTATPVQATGTAVVALANRAWNEWDTVNDMSNVTDSIGLTFDTPPGYAPSTSTARPSVKIGIKNYTSATGQSNTWTSAVTTGRVYGAIGVFKDTGGAVGNLFVHLAGHGGLASAGGLAGKHGGLAA